MESIRLEFTSEIREKLLELLSTFTSDELQITEDESQFAKDKKKLHLRAQKIDNGTAQYCTFEELDTELEKTISKYED